MSTVRSIKQFPVRSTHPSGAPEVTDGGPRLASSVTLSLPMPPSANALFKNLPGKGRVKTRQYDDWLGHAGWVLRSQRPGKISGPYLTVHSFERDCATADVDNRIKAIHDLLVLHHVTDDDRFLVGSLLAWAPAASKMMRVMVLPAADYSFHFKLAHDGSTGGFFLSEPQPEQEPA